MKLGRIIQGDALEVLRTLPAKFAQVVVTSPPFWGLRDYRVDGESLPGQYGQEATPEEHVAVMVAVFRELRRVLRHDGTLWLNYGDCYASQGGGRSYGSSDNGTGRADAPGEQRSAPRGLKPKDLVGMPWRVAMALQADGWWLRSDIIWAKPNPMPESVADRPTSSHEYLFLLTKRARYFYDAEAVREKGSENTHRRAAIGGVPSMAYKMEKPGKGNRNNSSFQAAMLDLPEGSGRNLRSVWNIATQPYPGAHFATFPEALVRPCIKAGSSEKGACPACAAPWARVVEKGFQGAWHDHKDDLARGNRQEKGRESYKTESTYESGTTAHRLALLRQQARANGGEYVNAARTIDWRPTCGCEAGDPVPCIVLDPFAGSGTVGIVAYKLGREFVGIDLAGGDADMGGHTAHDRIDAARDGRPLDEYLGHREVGQTDLLEEL